MDQVKHTEHVLDWLKIRLAANRGVVFWENDLLGKKDSLTLTMRQLISAFQERLWAPHLELEHPESDIRQADRMLAEDKSLLVWPEPDSRPFSTNPGSTSFSSS
jgi:hypothetical protein